MFKNNGSKQTIYWFLRQQEQELELELEQEQERELEQERERERELELELELEQELEREREQELVEKTKKFYKLNTLNNYGKNTRLRIIHCRKQLKP